MDHQGTDASGRRNMLNGLVTAATKSWRHGLQQNGHASNAMVFPTVATAINTSSPTSRTHITDSITMAEEQHRRLQQQRHLDHRLNVLWYGGDDVHQQNQSIDDWEKQPLRQQQQRSQRLPSQQYLRKTRPALPGLPIVWAAVLLASYASAMAAVYHVYGSTTGSGWVWFRGIVGSSSSVMWLWKVPATWYYVVQAFCAAAVGIFLCQWCCQQKLQQKRFYYYVLLLLFSTAIFPSIPIAEIFNSSKIIATSAPSDNSTTGKLQQFNHYNSEEFDHNRLTLYEGLWQVTFFVFLAYCLVLPLDVPKKLGNQNDKHINEQIFDEIKNFQNDENRHVTVAVLFFAIIASIGHTSLNAYFAYNWYFQRKHHQENSLIKPMAAIQQLIANTVVLTSINLIGWLLRQSVVRDRSDCKNNKSQSMFTYKHEHLRFTLRRQAQKLNLLLASLLPRRVFSQMKYEIVADAARSYNGIYSSSKNDDYFHKSHLQHPQEEIQLLSPQSPKMYLKEYDNVSIVCASITGFWDNVSAAASHGESGFLQSRQLITLVDRLMADLYRKMAQRNHCLPIRLLGHRSYFVAGLPSEESYGFENVENARCKIGDDGHARNAIQLGLDLINAINMVVHDVSRRRYGHKINLNIRVGIHSGRVTCGVLGFTGGMDISSESGSRWQYEVWGRDVLMASEIESNGRPGWVHVSQATVDNISKKSVPAAPVSEKNYDHPGVIFRDHKNSNFRDYKTDYTFERGGNLNRINTYFVVPKTTCPNSEVNEDITRSDDYDDNLYGDDIESLILQSVDRQLQKEDIRKQYETSNSVLETEMMSETQLPTLTTTAVGEVTVVAASMIPAAPGTTIKMIMNRHRRSRYEQELLQSSTKNNSSFATTDKGPSCKWEEDVFGVSDNYNIDKVRSKSDDDDLFRLAKSQLLLLCVIITLFVVNVTTMPWTMLLGITFITPFVVTAGELIYVMAMLIGWIARPKLQSTTYLSATIADDYEYYHHYDDDNYDSDSSSSSSESVGGCLSRILVCRCPRNCSVIEKIFKPFRRRTNNIVTTRNPLDNNNNRWWCIPKLCSCCYFQKRHCWFAWCSDKNRESSCVPSDDSDIESRLGFRNEHAVMAATSGVSPPQQQVPNRLLHAQTSNSKHSNRRLRQRHMRLKRKYQDEERHTWFFWVAACNEVFVVLLICLLALLNAFTCEPVMMTNAASNQLYAHNLVNNNGGRFNNPIANVTQQPNRSPLTCPWPQYAVLTCCLACISIAIAFPIYYGSLPTLRMKIGTLCVMTFVFAIAFVHFTHQHVFHAASISSLKPSCCSKFTDVHDYQKVDSNISNNANHQETKIVVRRDLYQEDKRFKLQEEDLWQVAGLDTATTTVYVVTFAAALLIYFVYAHRLKDRRAHHRVKMDCDERRLGVLRLAHRRTLHSFIPDHVAHSLHNSFHSGNINLNDNNCFKGANQPKNKVFIDPRSIPMTVANNQGCRDVAPNISRPLYYCGYRAVVVIFATIVQHDHLLTSSTNSGESRGYCHRQLGLLNKIFSEFDVLLDSQKFCGLVEKIKMVGTNTYMAAVGLQHQHGPERQLLMLLREMKRRNTESCNYNNQNKKSDLDSYSCSKDNGPADGYELYDVISANYVIFALDFIQYMRRILHRRQTAELTSAGNVHVSQISQLTLKVGVNVGPVVAGLIGCNDGTWKQPKFDVWGNTVNVAKQMETTGVAGCTQVTNCVVDVMKSIKDPKYEFEIRTKATSKDNKRITYFVRENFDRNDSLRPIQQQQQQFSLYHQLQFQQNAVVHKNNYLGPDRLTPYKHIPAARSPQNVHRVMPSQFDHEQCTSRPIVTVHPQHSYYNAMLQQQMRQKCAEPIKTPPPPPPKRSPLSVNIERMQHAPYPMFQQHGGEPDRYSGQRQQARGAQKQRAPDPRSAKPEVTYARPLQQHKLQKQSNKLSSCQPSPPPQSSDAVVGPARTPDGKQQQQQPQQRLCRPNALALVKNFDADRPLPSPPRTSDTAAGRPRHHHDPRRRRRGQPGAHHRDDDADAEQSTFRGAAAQGWPSSSSCRPSSSPSSSSSGSADAGNTTASNNNYNTTTATSSSSSSSSSDESFGPVPPAVQDLIGDFDTAASSAAVSSAAVSPAVSRRYRQPFRQWSPAATGGSSPVRRSSSFRSPIAAAAGPPSSCSPRSPLAAGCTQSLNRRHHVRPINAVGGGGGGSSGRRKRRRQQPHTAADASERPASPQPPAGTAEDVAETPASPPPSLPRKKQQQHRGRPGGGPATSPDFTDEIRRILLLDHHRGNVRMQQRGAVDDDDSAPPVVDRPLDGAGKEKIEKDAKRPPSPVQQPSQAAKTTSADRKSDKNDDGHNQNKKGGDDSVDDTGAMAVPEAAFDSDMSSSAFKERERQITEQVKRQEAEVRRILQAQKNNAVTVAKGTTAVTPETRVHGFRQQAAASATAESSEWSDDESLEPLSLQDDRLPGPCSGFLNDYVGNSSLMTAEFTSGCEGDGYTTGGDGDGYTTTGYTTDDAVAADIANRMNFVRNSRLPATSARHLDDNLSTMNDTGLTDAEAALSDVNSMIDYNDGYDSNLYESRRQSSLSSSSVCPYASDSLCDDDDYNDEGEFNFNDDYDVDDDKPDSCDDDDFNHRHYNLNRLLQQQQMFLSQPATTSPPASTGVRADNNKLYSQQQQQSQHPISSDTASNVIKKPDVDGSAAATIATGVTSVSTANNTSGSKSTAATSTINTTTVSTNTEPVKQSPPIVRNKDSNSNNKS